MILMKSVTFLILISITSAFGQEYEKIFYNNLDNPTSEDSSASWYSTWPKGTQTYERKSFYLPSNTIKSTENIVNGRLEGESVHYHPNGQLYYKTNYFKGLEIGIVELYYPNGKIHWIQRYDSTNQKSKQDGERMEYSTLQYFDSLGSQTVTDGNGWYPEFDKTLVGYKVGSGRVKNGLKDSTWVGLHEDGKVHYIEKWENGRLIKGESFWAVGETYTYDRLVVQASPANGMGSFYKHVSSTMKYPKEARRHGVQGKVFVEFVVDNNGAISNIKVIRGIGSGCDEEAIAAIASSPNWKPGLQRGRPVRSRFNLALIFKLN